MNAQAWIQQLDLTPHPEGGHYRELYHSGIFMEDPAVQAQYGGLRETATSIYFLLETTDVSRFHRLKSDEIWYFHAGSPLTVHVISPDGAYSTHKVGLDVTQGQSPQVLIPRGHIFGATVDDVEDGAYAVVSCMVTPGFDFDDFELFDRETLMSKYPEHHQIIQRLTKP
ncbi:cupin domain-containing protein [Alicyclobacillus fastidiosus]|uniref:Cupin domain-containing protein n=1 Tax=Alicyclobacillus fastidiosus TaxID=392011 RepID=A0ABY6ZFR9_9BACL|nr:cupin domain-containing protein [Alicyclobacillus fastidiosus]WAH40955.1 cupin domain-containing protein [Alicyclobacillus fastidiosus]GMA62466.1 cupin [Alicyclobacillus fastidiosus]